MTIDHHDPTAGSVFRHGDFAVLRLAALPAAAAAPDETPAELDDAEALTTYLQRLLADPVLSEAIEVSSQSLTDSLDRIRSGRSVPLKKLRRAALSVTRYLLRTTGRPTPFGLHAGVVPVSIGSTARLRIGAHPTKDARPDAGWSHAVLFDLIAKPGELQDVRVCANNLCEQRADRLVLGYPRGGGQGVPSPSDGEARPGRAREVSVGFSPAVQSAVRAARRPIAYAELRSLLLREFGEPDRSDEAQDEAHHAVDRLLTGLLGREILLLDEATVVHRIDPDQRIARALTAYRDTSVGQGRDAWREAVSALHSLHHTDRPPAHVDLRMDAEAQLPSPVLSEAARVAGVLWRMGPQGTGAPALEQYHGEFLERYGTDRVVPVAELLDQHRGLGPPAGYRNPPSERAAVPKPENLYPAWRDERLAELLWDCEGDELVLDDEQVAELAGESGSAGNLAGTGESQEKVEEPPPDSLDLCVQVFSESESALTDGSYTLAIAPGAGSLIAGAMAGRFTDLLGLRAELGAALNRQDDDRLYAQLFFRSATPRRENVMQVPQILPYRVSIGRFDDPDDPYVIDQDRIAVGSTGDRLYLTVPDLGRELCVLAPHMLNQVTDAPNLARFLNTVSLSGVRPFAPWNWGRLNALPRLPRVRYRRTILAPAFWRPSPALSELARYSASSGAQKSFQDWRKALDEWRKRLDVPRVVHAGVLDNHLELDLENELHQRILHDHLRRHDPSPVWEPPSTYGSLGFTAGHHNEFAIPLRSRRPRLAMPTVPAWRAYAKSGSGQQTRVRHHPGGEWMHIRLPMVADLQDRFLVGQLPLLLGQLGGVIDRWFFLRYRDPEPHLRLRLGGDPDRLCGQALPVLRRWADQAVAAGLLAGIGIGSYEPEVERYGGPTAMDAAESVFCADSVAVLRQLEFRTRDVADCHEPSDEALVAMNQADILTSLGHAGDWDWRQWVLDSYPAELEHRVPAAERAAAVETIAAPADALRALWRPRDDAIVAYGKAIGIGTDELHQPGISAILHMHANRALGTDRSAERRALGLLRASARRHLEERRHHRDRNHTREHDNEPRYDPGGES